MSTIGTKGARYAAGARMSDDPGQCLERVRDAVAKARTLRQIMRTAPDQLRRDAAIIAYSRNLDRLVDDLMTLEDMGLLQAVAARLPELGLR